MKTNTHDIGSIGPALRMAREAAGLSQRELARRSGLSFVHINRVELQRCQPTPSVTKRMASALGCEVLVTIRRVG